MTQSAKIFINGRSQAVRLPAAFRFDVPEVYVRQDPTTGDVILSRRPNDWTGFLQALQGLSVPAGFLGPSERKQRTVGVGRDPLAALD